MNRLPITLASLAILTTGTDWGQAIVTIGGNTIVNRDYVDEGANLSYLDSNYPFSAEGYVDT